MNLYGVAPFTMPVGDQCVLRNEPIKLVGITPTLELSVRIGISSLEVTFHHKNIDSVTLRFRYQHQPRSVDMLGLG